MKQQRTDAGVRLKQGKTQRSDLAVRAFRTLHGDVPRRPDSGTTRRFILQSRLEALLKILTPAETAYYYQETRVLGQR